ncbi:MAG: hypothetical protein D3914_14025 [Candidatus Electrothrix sp. LOE2]|nr:hypothetical protein [Candidatus Electrothrix sp. LOE2]
MTAAFFQDKFNRKKQKKKLLCKKNCTGSAVNCTLRSEAVIGLSYCLFLDVLCNALLVFLQIEAFGIKKQKDRAEIWPGKKTGG